MKKVDSISQGDWERIAAGLKANHDTALHLYTMLVNSLGRSHPATQKALRAYRRAAGLESDVRNLAKENARDMFEGKEIERLFLYPNLLQDNLSKYPNFKNYNKEYGGISYGTYC